MVDEAHTVNILIAYYSPFGVLRLLAERIAAGVSQVPGAEPHLLEIPDRPVDLLEAGETQQRMQLRRAAIIDHIAAADALIVGTPAYFGSMASAVKRLFEELATAADPPVTDRTRPWHINLFRDKVGAAFTASATPHGGNELALHSVLTMMMHMGMIVVTPGQREPILENEAAPYGPTAQAGPAGDRVPPVAVQDEARDLGERVARVAVWLHGGRTEWEKTHAAREPRSSQLAGYQAP